MRKFAHTNAFQGRVINAMTNSYPITEAIILIQLCMRRAMIVIIMGVCGSGKTAVAEELGKKLQWPIAEADDYHPECNKTKMAAGIPLVDEDRLPWLISLHEVIREWHDNNTDGIVTCSALKKKYRNILIHGGEHLATGSTQELNKILFVHLHGTKEVISQRMGIRRGHFMPSSLLESQLKTLEIPTQEENALIVNIDKDFTSIMDVILNYLNTHYQIKLS